jgi:hypothetical protein
VRFVLVGETAADVIAGRDAGHVLAVLRRGVYLAFPRGVVALVDRHAEPGPLHAHVDRLPRVAIGDPVSGDGGGLWIAGAKIAGGADVWRAPPLPAPLDLATVAATLRGVLDHSPDLDLGGGAGPASEERLSATLRRHGLGAAATELAGRGAGLTPAGDDVLAGLFLVDRGAAGPRREPLLVALAREAATHEISRAYLESAGRGRSLAAVHDLIGACAVGDAAEARAARARLARIGHSSGLDLSYGVLVGSATLAASSLATSP